MSVELKDKCVKNTKLIKKKYVDYVWISLFYIFLITISGLFFTNTTVEDSDKILRATNNFNMNMENINFIYLSYCFTKLLSVLFVG
jgi:hypothetical protein